MTNAEFDENIGHFALFWAENEKGPGKDLWDDTGFLRPHCREAPGGA